VLTVQPRIATGQFDFEEIPAGMLDGSGNFAGVAAKEIEEELGFKIKESELIDLSSFAGHSRGAFTSPGGSDETTRFFAFIRKVSARELASITGRCTGLISEGEQITLKVVPLEDLWMIPDTKTITAYTLYKQFCRKSTR
jgi:ADP-sugar diphosphatase